MHDERQGQKPMRNRPAERRYDVRDVFFRYAGHSGNQELARYVWQGVSRLRAVWWNSCVCLREQYRDYKYQYTHKLLSVSDH